MKKKELTNKEKLIKLYKKSLKTGKLPYDGLCTCLKHLNIPLDKLELFKPNYEEEKELVNENKSPYYWAAGIEYHPRHNAHRYKFTPLRQIILGFLIAMED